MFAISFTRTKDRIINSLFSELKLFFSIYAMIFQRFKLELNINLYGFLSLDGRYIKKIFKNDGISDFGAYYLTALFTRLA